MSRARALSKVHFDRDECAQGALQQLDDVPGEKEAEALGLQRAMRCVKSCACACLCEHARVSVRIRLQ